VERERLGEHRDTLGSQHILAGVRGEAHAPCLRGRAQRPYLLATNQRAIEQHLHQERCVTSLERCGERIKATPADPRIAPQTEDNDVPRKRQRLRQLAHVDVRPITPIEGESLGVAQAVEDDVRVQARDRRAVCSTLTKLCAGEAGGEGEGMLWRFPWALEQMEVGGLCRIYDAPPAVGRLVLDDARDSSLKGWPSLWERDEGKG